jgi:membrane protease YdiL (CAAX protease family)
MIPGPDDELEPGGEAEPFPAPPYAVALTLAVVVLRLFALAALLGTLGPRLASVGISTLVAFGAVFAFCAPRIPEPPGETLGFRRAARRAWLAVPFLVPSLLLISELDNIAAEFLPRVERAGDDPRGPNGLAEYLEWGIVLVGVLPLCQEIFFRGLLQPGVVATLGRLRGVLLVAALQGIVALLAFGPRAVVLGVSFGLVLGLLRESARSILPGLALYALFGVVSLTTSAELFGIPGFDDLSADHTPLEWLAPAAVLVGVGLGLCRTALREERSA